MISPSSLAAFTPAIQAPSQATRVAAPTAARADTTGSVQKPLQTLPSGSQPTRATPRGSLLDLSV